MTPLEDIDLQLAHWNQTLARISDSLVDLDADPTYAMLERTQPDGFRGVSRERIAEAVTSVQQLFADRSALAQVLERAVAIRATVTKLRHGGRLAEIDRLLNGDSVDVPPQPGAGAERGLLDPPSDATRATPAQLLASMTAAFERARAVVADVDRVWTALGERADAVAARIEQLADSEARHAARTDLDRARSALSSDPLGAGAEEASSILERLEAMAAPADRPRSGAP